MRNGVEGAGVDWRIAVRRGRGVEMRYGCILRRARSDFFLGGGKSSSVCKFAWRADENRGKSAKPQREEYKTRLVTVCCSLRAVRVGRERAKLPNLRRIFPRDTFALHSFQRRVARDCNW